MKNIPEKSGFWANIHVPVPRVLRDAFMRIPKPKYFMDPDYFKEFVGYHAHDHNPRKKEEELKPAMVTDENHGYYLGKFIKQGISQKIARLMGWQTEPIGIYSPQFIKAMLEYAFSNSGERKGNKRNIFLCPILSKLFNGPYEGKGKVMTFDEQKKLIEKIATKMNHSPDSLNILNIEDVEAHKPLIDLLKSSVDPETKIANPDVLAQDGEEIELDENSTSLDIARYLYVAIKENQVLQEVFGHLVPEGLNDFEPNRKQGDDEFKMTPRICYGLTEISIRLWEILHGRFIHGGVDRQGKYDEVIEKIVRGKNGGFKKIPELSELFKLFEGKRFDTIHISTERNPHRFAIEKTMAKVRLTIIALMGLIAAFGVHKIDNYAQNREAEGIRRTINMKLNGVLENVTMYLDDSSPMKLPIDAKINRFNYMVRDLEKEMERRYSLSEAVIHDLEPFLMEYLMTERVSLDTMYNNWHFAAKKLDEFMEQKEFYFLSKDIKVGRPYEESLKFLPQILDGLEDGDLDRDYKYVAVASNLTRIGTVSVPDKKGVVYTLFIYNHYEAPVSDMDIIIKRKRGESIKRPKVCLLAARGDVRTDPNLSTNVELRVTSQDGMIAAKAFLDIQKKFDIRKFDEYSSYFEALSSGIVEPDCNFSVEEGASGLFMLPRYTDFMGRFDYEMALYKVYENGKIKGQYLVARASGDEKFTVFKACQAAQYYREAAYVKERADDSRDEAAVKADVSQCEYLDEEGREEMRRQGERWQQLSPNPRVPESSTPKKKISFMPRELKYLYPRRGERPLGRPMKQYQYRSPRRV